MADKVRLTSPTGHGVAKVAPARVEAFKANGWREVQAPKPRARAKRQPKQAEKPADEGK